MSLMPFGPSRSMMRAFDQMFNDDMFYGRFPYWRNVPGERSLALGSPIGEVENTPEKFVVAVDVSHFRPDEIKVNVAGHELTIAGDHEEKSDEHGTIKRSFVRKYTLPSDTNVEALRSSLDDDGRLTIEAPKKTAALNQARAIPITRG